MSEPRESSPSADQLIAAFGLLAGRPKQVLVASFVERRATSEVATHLGTSPAAAELLVFRALGELQWALASGVAGAPPPVPAMPEQLEVEAAAAVARGLSAEPSPAPPDVQARIQLGRAVLEASSRLRDALVPPPPPPRSRGQRIFDAARRIAWLAIVIAAAVLYSRWTTR